MKVIRQTLTFGFIFVTILLFIGISHASLKSIEWQNAKDYIGKYVSVEGHIVSAKNTGEICYLNFGRDYKNTLSVVIFKNNFGNFPNSPESYYNNKTIEVRGKITTYKDLIQLIIQDQKSIKIVKNEDLKTENPNYPKNTNQERAEITGKIDYNGILIISSILVICVILIGFIFSFKHRSSQQNLLNAVRDTVGSEVGKAIPQMIDAISNIHNVDNTEKIANSLSKNYNGRFLHNQNIRNEFIDILRNSAKEVDIISPWLSDNAIDNQVFNLFESALKNGVTIKIIYGYQGGKYEQKSQEIADKILAKFSKYRDRFIIKRINTHAKLLLCDNDVMMVGSYNLLSFGGKYTSKTRNEMMMLLNNQELVQKLRKLHFNF